MRIKVVCFLSIAVISSFVVGCAGPEQKLGRGINNTVEFARLGELRRSMEQAEVFDTPGSGGVAAGFFHGIDRSFARTGAGLYEVVTFPIPNHKNGDYGPIFYSHNALHTADPVYPDSYTPDWLADPTLQPDTALGFAGGDIAPWAPGSRFRIFDN